MTVLGVDVLQDLQSKTASLYDSFVRYFDKENLSIPLESVEKEEVSGALGRHILDETRRYSGN